MKNMTRKVARLEICMQQLNDGKITASDLGKIFSQLPEGTKLINMDRPVQDFCLQFRFTHSSFKEVKAAEMIPEIQATCTIDNNGDNKVWVLDLDDCIEKKKETITFDAIKLGSEPLPIDLKLDARLAQMHIQSGGFVKDKDGDIYTHKDIGKGVQTCWLDNGNWSNLWGIGKGNKLKIDYNNSCRTYTICDDPKKDTKETKVEITCSSPDGLIKDNKIDWAIFPKSGIKVKTINGQKWENIHKYDENKDPYKSFTTGLYKTLCEPDTLTVEEMEEIHLQLTKGITFPQLSGRCVRTLVIDEPNHTHKCDCGAAVANDTHAPWCSTKKESK